ncbi:MAG: DNA-formamidopyrimidine glycosylase [Microcoleaceae cyanobacterium]
MPELPEVETVRRGLNQATLGWPIGGGQVLLDRTVAYPLSTSDFLDGLTGKKIVTWHRRGKYLLAELAAQNGAKSQGWLGVHLRMTGQLLWLDAHDDLQKHARVRLFFDQGQELRFVDQRTFGQMWWVPPSHQPPEIISGLKQLGPEPFDSGFSVEYLAQYFHRRQRPVKNALLDQRLVAGLGNIYADEALFLSGIRPATLCSQLKLAQIQRLHQQIRQVLEDAIQAGGTTIRNFLSVAGVNGNYSQTAWVYGREGEACRVCGTSIQRIKLAGRSAHFCPQCQQS